MSDKEYIATQAPKTETVGDFWQMVWQEDVTTIAMIAQGSKGLMGEVRVIQVLGIVERT
jgi:protein tyrosine phosphatase